MSNLGFLEKLLDGAGVEWLPLEKVAKIKHGKDWKKLNDGDVPVYGSGGIMGYVDTFSHDRPTVLIPRKGSITNIFYVEEPFWNVDTIYYTEIDTSQVVPKYLYHFIKTIDLMALDTGSGRPSLTQAILNRLEVPIPCPEDPEKSLAIQAEIVRILDAFTELTAELTAELKARKKQYNHYRDQLLSFEDGDVEWRDLETVANFTNGKGHEKVISTGGKYIVVNSKFISTSGRVAKHTDNQICPLFTDDILLVMSDLPNGKALAKTFFVDADDKYTLNQRIGGISVRNPKHLLPKFLYYFLDRNKQLTRFDNGADQTNLRKGQILSVQIPIPFPSDPEKSLAEQARIVTILDKFDTLTTSLSEGLPREIKLRRQQYEYYRDLLLSFPKPDEAA